MTDEPPPTTTDAKRPLPPSAVLSRGTRDDVPLADVLSIIKPYFRTLQDEASLLAYMKPSALGAPHLALASWKDQPAGFHSVFPFPLAIDGQNVVAGKPELGSLHSKVVLKFPRPDIFGELIDDLVVAAGERGWPILVTWPTPVSKASHNKKGFHDLVFGYTRIVVPLSAALAAPLAFRELEKRPLLAASKIPASWWRSAATVAMTGFTAIVRAALATLPQRYDFKPIAVKELAGFEALLTGARENGPRIAFWREPAFLASRLREEDGYRVIGVSRRGAPEVEGLVVLRELPEGLFVYDVLPPAAGADPALWGGLARYGIARGAGYMMANFYATNPAHQRALAALRGRLPAIATQASATLIVRVVDPAYDFARELTAWEGTDMLGVGF